MGEAQVVTVELDDAATALIDGVVAQGRFTDAAEVLRFAMALFAEWEEDQQEEWAHVDVAEIQRLWDEGVASGVGGEVTDEWFESIKREGRERLAARRAAAE